MPAATSPTAYTDNNDGTITDNITGLMWQSPPAATTMTQAAAITYCSTMLSVGGHSDWRLPTKIELFSIVDLARSIPPALNPIFAGTLLGTYWTSTSNRAGAWVVDFNYGSTSSTVASVSHVPCVR